MSAQIEKEPLDRNLFDELLPLARKCWAENTVAKADHCAFYGERDFEIEPDFEAYERLEKAGVLVIITLRIEGQLQGYVEGWTYRSMRHKKFIGGYADSCYLEPDQRAYFPVMRELFEKELQALGAVILGWPTIEGGSVHAGLAAAGYVGDDLVMEKKLCA